MAHVFARKNEGSTVVYAFGIHAALVTPFVVIPVYSAGTTKVKHGLYGLYTTLRKVAISASIFCYGCFRKFQQADDYLRIFERTYFTSDNHCTVL